MLIKQSVAIDWLLRNAYKYHHNGNANQVDCIYSDALTQQTLLSLLLFVVVVVNARTLKCI